MAWENLSRWRSLSKKGKAPTRIRKERRKTPTVATIAPGKPFTQ
jgi:hypothetical protein